MFLTERRSSLSPPGCVSFPAPTVPAWSMHVLYLDGSGTVRNPNERYFVLAGVALFERRIFHLIKAADEFVADLQEKHSQLQDSSPHEIELHASIMANGKRAPWKGISRASRLDIIQSSLSLFDGAKAFAVAVNKRAISPNDPVEYAFEEILSRFDHFLKRVRREKGEGQRGLVVMDKSSYEVSLQQLARQFRDDGTRWGNLRNLAEVPLFVDSAASRAVQLADLLAWSVWRRYEFHDTRYFDRLANRFDKQGSVIHGLVHYRDQSESCMCPACVSRGR